TKSIAITAAADSDLAKYADLTILTPKIQEACRLNLAPTSSTTAAMVIGDALAVAVSTLKDFNRKNFALYHPAGSIGKKLLVRVQEIMHTGEKIPIIYEKALVKDALIEISKKKLGVVFVATQANKLAGILTDGDIRRAFEKKVDIYNAEIDVFSTKNPVYVTKEVLAVDALRIMSKNGIATLAVINEKREIDGIITSFDIIRNGIIL
ncbi:MAG: CBS domain-containing protein, partial [Firmicutes bacterium]|nr:CBS domain-containing protein [Bacillota bacterium]